MMLREEQLPSDICTYWPANPAFDPKRVLLRRMFFINQNKTKYVSVSFYPARDYQPQVEFGAIRRGRSKSIILTDEQFDTFADYLPAIRDSMCVGENRVNINSRVAAFDYTRRGGTARPDSLSARST